MPSNLLGQNPFAAPTVTENSAASAGTLIVSQTVTTGQNLIARIEGRRFNFAVQPPEPITRFFINRKAVCTPGNLTNIIAQAKAGKSALIGAVVSAAICAEFAADDRDTLGVTATAPGKLRLIHLDTEQSPFDHDQQIRRALRRAGIAEPPPWLFSYGLAGFSAKDLREVLRITLREAHASGGTFAAIVDGAADLVNDVNDSAECNDFVAELQDLAIRNDCPILSVVHENPGKDGGKMRGHLGSQLERKAESNLRLKKSDGVTVVFSEKMRRAPIYEKDGPRFRWDDGAAMHVSCDGTAREREAESRENLRLLAEGVFRGDTLRYADACKRIEKARGVGEKASEKWFTRMKKEKIIKEVGKGFWGVNAA